MLNSIRYYSRAKTENLKPIITSNEFIYYNDFWSNFKEHNKIENGLILGSQIPIKDFALMESIEISHILSVTEKPIPESERMVNINYFHVEAGDFPDQDLLSSFDECFKFISDAQNKDQNVYVHCVAGVSRSATIVIAFIMKKYKLSTDEAFKRVYKKRKVFPNEGFKYQLELYERMNFMANPNCKEYRRFLLKTLTYKLRTGKTSLYSTDDKTNTQFQMSLNYEQISVRNYFDKLAIAEQMVTLEKGRSFHCFYCKTELFNEINIINDRKEESIEICWCEDFFIEPLQTYCTQPDSDKTGLLKCPNCLRVFGYYNWLLYHSQCSAHQKYKECLALKVINKNLYI